MSSRLHDNILYVLVTVNTVLNVCGVMTIILLFSECIPRNNLFT